MLNDKKTAFCHEYIKDWNAKEAALRAGYKNGNSGYQLMCDPEVVAFIDKLKEEAAIRNDITVYNISNALNEIAKNEAEKTSDRIRAYELLGKYLGMFTEKHEVKGQIDTAVTKLDGILKQLD